MRSVLHIQKVKYIAGSENHLLMLLPRLQEHGYEPTMLVLADSEDHPEAFCERMMALGVPTDVVNMRADLDALLLWKLRRYIHHGNFDLVHGGFCINQRKGALRILTIKITYCRRMAGWHLCWSIMSFIYAPFATSEPEANRYESQKVYFVRRSNSVSHLVSHNSILKSS